MTVFNERHDLSDALELHRYGNGIKLLRPENRSPSKPSPSCYKTGFTVGCALSLPYSIYFMDLYSCIKKGNDSCAMFCGFDSIKESIGKSVRDTLVREYAAQIIDHDQTLLRTNRVSIFEEEGILQWGEEIHKALSIKGPLYNEFDETIGFFGVSIFDETHDRVAGLKAVADLGLLIPNTDQEETKHAYLSWDNIFQLSSGELDTLLTNRSYALTFNNHKIGLSKMEIKTLIQLIRGQHAGEIAQVLNIKQSTVESYLFNIKNKLGVSAKSELIAQVTASNLLNQIRI